MKRFVARFVLDGGIGAWLLTLAPWWIKAVGVICVISGLRALWTVVDALVRRRDRECGISFRVPLSWSRMAKSALGIKVDRHGGRAFIRWQISIRGDTASAAELEGHVIASQVQMGVHFAAVLSTAVPRVHEIAGRRGHIMEFSGPVVGFVWAEGSPNGPLVVTFICPYHVSEAAGEAIADDPFDFIKSVRFVRLVNPRRGRCRVVARQAVPLNGNRRSLRKVNDGILSHSVYFDRFGKWGVNVGLCC